MKHEEQNTQLNIYDTLSNIPQNFRFSGRLNPFYQTCKSFIGYDKNTLVSFLLRDYPWAVISNKGLGHSLKPTSNLISQFCGQWAYPTVIVMGGLAVHKTLSYVTNFRMSEKAAPAAISTCAAIPAWFWACEAGKKVGAWLNLSPVNAKYFAGLFTGVAEGVAYEFVNTIMLLCLSEKARKKYNKNPIGYLKGFAKSLICSATIGAIPGALWQFMAVVCEVKEIESLLGQFVYCVGRFS